MSRSSSSLDSESEEGSDEVYEEASNKCAQKMMLGFTLHILNEALVRYGCQRQRSRKRAAEILADKLHYDSDSDD